MVSMTTHMFVSKQKTHIKTPTVSKMYKKTTKASAIYHIKDDIKHFKFNLSFQHINSLLNLPKFDVKSGGSVVAKSEGTTDKDNCLKVLSIKWQQKIFSAHEIEFFSDINNCITDVQKSYHELILENQNEQQDSLCISNEPIFTYVDEDNFIPESEKITSENALQGTNDSSNDKDIVQMYVYASINPNTILVSLRWHKTEKTLHIYPDFNNFRENPYFIEIDTDYRHLYAYGIENTSKQSQIRREVFPFAELKLPEIPHWVSFDELSAQFSMPPKRTRRVAILMEIQKAEGFEYDNIHVRYHIHLPERTILEEGLLNACTHSSQANSAGVCGFGHCLEIQLLCEEDFKLEKMCHVYFELISVDSWDRERCEGYAYLSFFLEKGCEATLLQCHRPIEEGILEKLNRSFIGGRRKFDFEKFYGGDLDFINRYGTTMATTGVLAVRYQILTQRNPELLRPVSGRMTGMTLEDIMKAYREGRRRLEAVIRLDK
ncbi:tectonic-like complex member Mks1 [Episyrphus balteatus]|uniref:tectonic-like complex member Mks1 n=1 Tax=Episyrphus balteatus TaxID=286459 RepID=UPI002485DA51|nr:tectonic-like complex member Mks1 [Episyrphus balteatus]